MQEATRKRYEADHNAFTQWASTRRLPTLPASSSTIARYLEERVSEANEIGEQLPLSTLERIFYAIAAIEHEAGYPDPRKDLDLRAQMQGLIAAGGVFTDRKHRAGLSRPEVLAIAQQVATDKDLRDRAPAAIRDLALIAVAHHGGLKNHHLAHLTVDDVRLTMLGNALLRVLRPRGQYQWTQLAIDSETLLDAKPRLEEWLAIRGVERGPLFVRINKGGALTPVALSSPAIGEIAVRRAAAAGITIAGAQAFRNGLITELDNQNVPIEEIGERLGYVETNHLHQLVAEHRRKQGNSATRPPKWEQVAR